jgi:hypothetical protein
MPYRMPIAAFLLTVVFALANQAAAMDNGDPAVPLLSTGTAITGETLHYPAGGAAHVTTAIAAALL